MGSKKTAVYPGSFDPVTYGHIDIMKRAANMFDTLIVGVIDNPAKRTLFSMDERMELLRPVAYNLKNIKLVNFKGLLVDFVKDMGADVIIRGLRAISDFENEFQMALMNRKLYDRAETIFLMPDERYTYLSSSIVKEIAGLGGDISDLVPDNVSAALKKFLDSPEKKK